MSLLIRSFLVAIIAFTLSGCSLLIDRQAVQPASSGSTASSWEPQGRCVTEKFLQEGVDLYRTEAPLSKRGSDALHVLLAKNGLLPLAGLRELGGTESLSPDLCRSIFALFNTDTENAASERCSYNIQPNGKTFEDYGVPIVMETWELENRYVVLFIDEEGLGSPFLFASIYDLHTDIMHVIDVSKINALDTPVTQITYSKNAIHYFWRGDSYSNTEKDCAGTEIATFDLKNGTLQIWK